LRLTHKLLVIVDYTLLRHLGFDPAEIEEAMFRTFEYTFYAGHSTWAWDNREA